MTTRKFAPPPTKFGAGAARTAQPKRLADTRVRHAPPPTKYGQAPETPLAAVQRMMAQNPNLGIAAAHHQNISGVIVVGDQPLDIFRQFFHIGGGFQYDPTEANCVVLANHLLSLLVQAGHAAQLISLNQGGMRYIVSTPSVIGRGWSGGWVLSGDSKIPGLTGFENHTAVTLAGTIYDPTGGYVGPADRWYSALSPQVNDDLFEYLMDVQAENYYKVDGPLPLPKRYAVVYEQNGMAITKLIDAKDHPGPTEVAPAQDDEDFGLFRGSPIRRNSFSGRPAMPTGRPRSGSF